MLWNKDDARSSGRDPVSVGRWRNRGPMILIHALALGATVNFFRDERKLGRTDTGFGADLAIVTQTISFAFVAHLIEIALWAKLFVICKEFQDFGTAYYHPAVNYTVM